jgi:hypothetical protein
MPDKSVAEIERERSPADHDRGSATSREDRERSDRPVEIADASPQSEEHGADDRRAEDAHAKAGEEGATGLKARFQKHPIAFLVCGGLIVIGAIGGVAWYFHERHYESTDDAFIDARPVLVSPQVTGNIIAVNVTDDQIVKAGDLLAKIDPRDYQAALNQADAQIRQAEATTKNLEAQISAQQAQIDQTGDGGSGLLQIRPGRKFALSGPGADGRRNRSARTTGRIGL